MRNDLYALAEEVGLALLSQQLILTTAESCTGGGIAAAVTAIAGSSQWFDRGFVTYSNQAKQEMLGVPAATLETFGAVSEATVREMAAGALRVSGAGISVAVSGIAGPSGGTADKPIGMVCFAWAIKEKIAVATHYLDGDRAAIQYQSVKLALQGLLQLLQRDRA